MHDGGDTRKEESGSVERPLWMKSICEYAALERVSVTRERKDAKRRGVTVESIFQRISSVSFSGAGICLGRRAPHVGV